MGAGYNWRQRTELKGKLQERQEGSEGTGSIQGLGDRSLIRECNISLVGHLHAQGLEDGCDSGATLS